MSVCPSGSQPKSQDATQESQRATRQGDQPGAVPAHPDTHKPTWAEASAARASRTHLAWLLSAVLVASCAAGFVAVRCTRAVTSPLAPGTAGLL